MPFHGFLVLVVVLGLACRAVASERRRVLDRVPACKRFA
jgi:hypothetical protein